MRCLKIKTPLYSSSIACKTPFYIILMHFCVFTHMQIKKALRTLHIRPSVKRMLVLFNHRTDVVQIQRDGDGFLGSGNPDILTLSKISTLHLVISTTDSMVLLLKDSFPAFFFLFLSTKSFFLQAGPQKCIMHISPLIRTAIYLS